MKALDIVKSRLPDILTGFNAIGVAATAWLTHRATKRAVQILEEYDDDISWKEEAKLTWRCYILPVVAAGATIASGIASNRVSAKRLSEAVAIGALYADRIEALDEKLKEKLTPEEYAKAKNDIKEKESQAILSQDEHGKMLCFEPESKQWFHASQQQLLMAEITANKMFKNTGELTLNQWLRLLPECKPKKWGDEWGWWETDEEGCADFNWSFYRGSPWIDIQPQMTERKNGEPYLAIMYGMHPMEKLDNQCLRSFAGKEGE